MAQFSRPIADITIDNWQGEDSSAVNLYQHIDETVASDADYVRTQLSPTNDVYVFKLGTVIDPEVSTGHIIRVRYGKDAPGGDTIDLTLQMRQGYISEASQGILVGEVSAGDIADGWTDFVYEIPGSTVDLITDYSQLYLRFIANKA